MASRDNFHICGTTFGSRENTHFNNYSALQEKSPKIWVQLSNLSLTLRSTLVGSICDMMHSPHS